MQEYLSSKASIKVIPVMGSQCFFTGTRITTLILEYPRAIHAQLLTHRVFSKNSSSTRAVPIKKSIQQIKENPAQFIWTENAKGMQGPVIDPSNYKLPLIEEAVNHHKNQAIQLALYLGSKEEEGGLNAHKQNVGRFLEPFQNIRVCLTSTEWDNWDWLRCDADAQGEIDELAKLIKQARDEMQYDVLKPGQWHVPFVNRQWDRNGNITYINAETNEELTASQAVNISMSVAAQTSYRNADGSLVKAEDMQDKLFGGEKVHASPSEHQAMPMGDRATETNGNLALILKSLPQGVTHLDRNGDCWSGNFKHWIQNRQLISNHDKAKF